MTYTKADYYRLKREGKCILCHRSRGKDGTEVFCRKCADKKGKYNQQRKKRRKLLGLCINCGQLAVNASFCSICNQKYLIRNAKARAKKAGLLFDITVEDVEWNTICPILGIPLMTNKGGKKDNSPSLDRVIPELGYVKGNVVIISMKANRIKNNATVEEIQKIVEWMKQKQL